MKKSISILVAATLAIFVAFNSAPDNTSAPQDPLVGVEDETLPIGTANPEVEVSWILEAKDVDVYEYGPITYVALVVNGHKVVIEENAGWIFHEMDGNDRTENNVPDYALSAVSGWWRSDGCNFYVVQKANAIIVFQGFFYENLDDPSDGIKPSETKYKKFKTIKINKLK